MATQVPNFLSQLVRIAFACGLYRSGSTKSATAMMIRRSSKSLRPDAEQHAVRRVAPLKIAGGPFSSMAALQCSNELFGTAE